MKHLVSLNLTFAPFFSAQVWENSREKCSLMRPLMVLACSEAQQPLFIH